MLLHVWLSLHHCNVNSFVTLFIISTLFYSLFKLIYLTFKFLTQAWSLPLTSPFTVTKIIKHPMTFSDLFDLIPFHVGFFWLMLHSNYFLWIIFGSPNSLSVFTLHKVHSLLKLNLQLELHSLVWSSPEVIWALRPAKQPPMWTNWAIVKSAIGY